MTSIQDNTFWACYGLTSVTIPVGIKSIGRSAFNSCTSLAEVHYAGSKNDWNEITIDNNNEPLTNATIYYAVDVPSLEDAEVTGIADATYTGEEITHALVVTLNGATLTENTDYTVSYANNVNVGTATVTITGIGNYTDSIERTFTIKKAAQSITAKASASTVAVGKTATVSTTGAKGTVTYSSSATSVATVDSETGKVTAKKVGTVTITAKTAETENYNAASKAVTIKVVPAATTSLSAANQSTGIKLTWKQVTGANGYYVYRNGTKIKTITSGATVVYSDTKANTNGSKYTYKVVAKASTGTSTLSKSLVTYRIARPAISSLTSGAAGKLTVKWGKNAKASGYHVQYCLKKDFSSGYKTVTITKNTTVSRTIGSLTKGKKYYVRVRSFKTVSGKKYFSAWSAAKAVTVKK